MRGLVLAAVLLLPLAGCYERPAVPRHLLIIKAEGAGYVLDGRPMAYDEVLAELDLLAGRIRTAPGDAARMVLSVRTEPGVPYDRVVELVDRCHALGINKIDTGIR